MTTYALPPELDLAPPPTYLLTPDGLTHVEDHLPMAPGSNVVLTACGWTLLDDEVDLPPAGAHATCRSCLTDRTEAADYVARAARTYLARTDTYCFATDRNILIKLAGTQVDDERLRRPTITARIRRAVHTADPNRESYYDHAPRMSPRVMVRNKHDDALGTEE